MLVQYFSWISLSYNQSIWKNGLVTSRSLMYLRGSALVEMLPNSNWNQQRRFQDGFERQDTDIFCPGLHFFAFPPFLFINQLVRNCF